MMTVSCGGDGAGSDLQNLARVMAKEGGGGGGGGGGSAPVIAWHPFRS